MTTPIDDTSIVKGYSFFTEQLDTPRPIAQMKPKDWADYMRRIESINERTMQWAADVVAPRLREIELTADEIEATIAQAEARARWQRENTGIWIDLKEGFSILLGSTSSIVMVMKKKMLFTLVILGTVKTKCIEQYKETSVNTRYGCVVAAVGVLAGLIFYATNTMR